jgi:GT2 family glycosyltransferase
MSASDRVEALSLAPQCVATPEDVCNAHRLLAGRDADAATLVEETRHAVDDVVARLVQSDAFAEVRRRVLLNAPLPEGIFPGQPDAALRQWAAGRLHLAPPTAALLDQAKSWKALLRRLLGDPHFVGSRPSAVPLSLKAMSAPADPMDVTQAYRLLLGREVHANDGADAAIGRPLWDLIAALAASPAFQASVVDPLFADAASAPLDIMPMRMLAWVRRRFGVDASIYDQRKALIGAILQNDAVAAALAAPNLPLTWTPSAVARRAGGRAEAAAPGDLLQQLQSVVRGLEVIQAQNLKGLGDDRYRMTTNDAAMVFALDAETFADAAAVELNLAVLDARQRAQGALYIDYGEGFAETLQVQLTPMGRTRYGAALLAPSRIKAIRWDPDNAEGDLQIAFIAARPLQNQEVAEAFGALAAAGDPIEGGVDRAQPAAKLCAISRLMTRRLYDHPDPDRGDYDSWIAAHEPHGAEALRLWGGELAALTMRPLISVLVPAYETPAPLLTAMIDSVKAQIYPHWELCLADDASKAPHVRQIIEAYAAEDPRIKAVFRPINGHISEASNSALELAAGDWLALLDHDDLLTPNALLEVAKAIAACPDAAFLYSDEDKLDAKGRRYDPFFKPDFSPELLRAQNYLNHLSVHRTALVRAAGGWRKGFEGSQDYDLNLRILERIDPQRVRHIPKVLYHWRAVEGSTALAGGEKDYAFTAGLRALEEHVARLGWEASVEPVGDLPYYRVRHALPAPAPLVSLIIPTRDHAGLLATCVDSVLTLTDYPSYEVVIVDNGSVEQETFDLFKRLTADARVRLVDQPGPFNYSRLNNRAVAESRGEIIALLNNDIEVITPGWMTEMAAWAAQPRIGCVGAKLYYPNDTIQHAGVILGIGGVAGHSHKYYPRTDHGYFSRLAVSHDVSAVTGACLYVRREIWEALGGLDERLAVAFNDVDFCIRVREAGYTNLFTPFAELYHHESLSRGAEDNPEKIRRFNKEVDFMKLTWAEKLSCDPLYSPNLSRVREDYSLRQEQYY